MSNTRPYRDEIRLNKDKSVLVEIGKRAWNDLDPSDESWAVKEIQTGQSYWLKQSSLGPSLTEMEVLAWASL